MKKILIMLGLVLCGMAVQAQSDSVKVQAVPADTAAIGSDTHKARPDREPNIQGEPIYYNYDQRKGYIADDGQYYAYRQPRHPYRTMSHDFKSYFCELEFLFGADDVAAGFQMAYVPSRWGGYASMMRGYSYDYFTLGAVLRLSEPDNCFDWQLYGGLAFSSGVGGEIGLRFAFDDLRTFRNVSLWSTSIGYMNVLGDGYVTFGLSLAVSGVGLLGLVF